MTRAQGSWFSITAIIAVGLIGALWPWSVPSLDSPTSLISTVLVALALGVIALKTWRSAQPTGSMSQLIHDTDAAEARTGALGQKPRS